MRYLCYFIPSELQWPSCLHSHARREEVVQRTVYVNGAWKAASEYLREPISCLRSSQVALCCSYLGRYILDSLRDD